MERGRRGYRIWREEGGDTIIWIQGGDTEYGYREEIQNMERGRRGYNHMDTGRGYNNMDTGRRYRIWREEGDTIIWIQGGDTEYGEWKGRIQ